MFDEVMEPAMSITTLTMHYTTQLAKLGVVLSAKAIHRQVTQSCGALSKV
jgi:hypothetical protein